MIKASAKVVDRSAADKLEVAITFTMPIGELRQLAAEVRNLNNPGDQSPAPPLRWPLGQFVRTVEQLVEKIVDRVDNAQAVES